MIYGHERERGWSTGGLLCGMAAGVVLGTGVGFLLALSCALQLDRSQPAAAVPAPRLPSPQEEEERTC